MTSDATGRAIGVPSLLLSILLVIMALVAK